MAFRTLGRILASIGSKFSALNRHLLSPAVRLFLSTSYVSARGFYLNVSGEPYALYYHPRHCFS